MWFIKQTVKIRSSTAKVGLIFVLSLENAFSWRFCFKTNRKSKCLLKNCTMDFQNSPPFVRSTCFYVTIIANFGRFQYFKVGFSPSKKICFICFNDRPSKMRKILFTSYQKLFSFSRYLDFCLTFWPCRKNGFIRKVRLISKIMTSQPG